MLPGLDFSQTGSASMQHAVGREPPAQAHGFPAAVVRPRAQQGSLVEMKARLLASDRSQEENEVQVPAFGAALAFLPAFASQVLFSVE